MIADFKYRVRVDKQALHLFHPQMRLHEFVFRNFQLLMHVIQDRAAMKEAGEKYKIF